MLYSLKKLKTRKLGDYEDGVFTSISESSEDLLTPHLKPKVRDIVEVPDKESAASPDNSVIAKENVDKFFQGEEEPLKDSKYT